MSAADAEREDDGSVDVEAAWADIVARWEDEGPGATPEAGPEAGPEAPAGETAAGAPEGPPPEQTTDLAWSTPTSHVGGERVRAAGARDDADPDDEGRYVPPDPPPLPRGDTISRLAWGGVLGAPIFFLLTMLFWRSVPTVLVVLAVAAFIAGFVTLVMRMPDRDDDGWDDGAVV